MSEIKKIDNDSMESVSGGVVINGHRYVKINKNDIEGYEHRCQTCGYIGYENSKICPRCQSENKCVKTGRFYLDYEKATKSATDSFFDKD